MKKTGQLLKDKREAANLSLSEVALATKINPKILTAIENGDEKSLPSKTFLKGFLRAYAVFLKIDAEEVLRSYQEELGGPPPEPRVHEVNKVSTTPQTPQRRRMDQENSSGMRTTAVIVIVILIGVIIGVRELIEKYQREKQVESSAIKVSPLAQPPLVPEGKPADSANPPVTTPTTAEAVPSTRPPQAAAPDPAAKPAQNAIVTTPNQPPPPSLVAPVEPRPAKPEEPKAHEEVTPVKEEASNADPAGGKKPAKNEIILEALDKVDVKFQIKGETKKLSLGPTQVHTIHTDQPVTLDISDGGAVNIILNGRERGVPGDLGKPKQIKIP